MSAKKRVRLNAEFLKLSKGKEIEGEFRGYSDQRCRDLDDGGEEQFNETTGEILMKNVRVLNFVDDRGIPFKMFESGALKQVNFEPGKTYALVGGEEKALGPKKRIKTIDVYAVE